MMFTKTDRTETGKEEGKGWGGSFCGADGV